MKPKLHSLFALCVLWATSTSVFAVGGANFPITVKPNGDVVLFSDGRVPNFITGREFKIHGTLIDYIPQEHHANLDLWSSLAPTVTAENLILIGLPGANSYIRIAPSTGIPSYKTALEIVTEAGVPTPNTIVTLGGVQALTGPKSYNGMTTKVATSAGTDDSPTETETPAAQVTFMITKIGWGATTGGLELRVNGPRKLSILNDGIVATVSGKTQTTADSTIASASTLALGSATGVVYDITGTATINLVTGIAAGEERIWRFTGAATVAHSANILCPGGKDIITDAGSIAYIVGKGSGVVAITDFKYSDGFSKQSFDDIYMNPGANIGFADEGSPYFDIGRGASGDGGSFWRFIKGDTPKLIKHDLTAAANFDISAIVGASRTYSFQNRDGIIADDTDLAAITEKMDVSCSVYNEDNISVTSGSGVPQALTFNNEHFDASGQHDTGSNPSRIVVPVTGKYLCYANIRFASSATGYRQVMFQTNGGDYYGSCIANATSGGAVSDITTSSIQNLTAGDYVEVSVGQNSGGALNVEVASDGKLSPVFSVIKMP